MCVDLLGVISYLGYGGICAKFGFVGFQLVNFLFDLCVIYGRSLFDIDLFHWGFQ